MVQRASRQQPSATPIGELADAGASISIESNELRVDLRPAHPVRLQWLKEADRYQFEVRSPQHGTVTVNYFDVANTPTAFDAFWATAGRLLSECQRVGDWIVGRDAEAELGVDVTELDRSGDTEAIEEYRDYTTDQRRQKLRVKSPTTGIDLTPPDPASYYPWVDPLDRPVLYTSGPVSDLDCPICGDYGRYGDLLHGIRCKTHGGFLTCRLRPNDNWVRTDDHSYREKFRQSSDSVIQKARVARDGYLLTLRPQMGGRMSPKDIRRHGYDMAAGPYADRPGMTQKLWRGTVDEKTTDLDDIEEYEVDDTVIFSQSEILAEKYRDEDIVLDRKPWASGWDFQQNFRDYRQKNSL